MKTQKTQNVSNCLENVHGFGASVLPDLAAAGLCGRRGRPSDQDTGGPKPAGEHARKMLNSYPAAEDAVVDAAL